jgi:hypothetical protein
VKHRFARDMNQNGLLLRSNSDSSKNHVGVLLVYKRPHEYSSYFRAQAFCLQTTILRMEPRKFEPLASVVQRQRSTEKRP